MLDRIRTEPALVLGLVQAALGLFLAFGLNLSNEQVGAIMAVTAAVLALVVRSQVTPTATERDDAGAGDLGLVLLVTIAIGVVLLLLGVRLG